MARTGLHYGKRPDAQLGVAAWVALALILVAGAALRLLWIGEPVAGYHAFNEAFYLRLGTDYAGASLLDPWFRPTDLNNPPLYPWLLAGVLRFFADSVVAARLLSVVASVSTAALLFVLGRRLYSTVGGLSAAAVMALSPGAVLVGRNIQIDALAALCMTAAVLAWVVSVDGEGTRETRDGAVAGALAGLGMLCKLQAVVIVPAIACAEVWRTRSLKVIVGRRALAALASFAIVGLSWHVWLAVSTAGYGSAQSRLAAMATLPDTRFFDVLLAREWLWLLSPPLFVVACAALVFLVWRRSAADVLVLALVGANLVFYAFYHHHTYYLYNAIPFVGLAVGALAARIVLWAQVTAGSPGGRARGVRAALIAVATLLAVSTALFAVAMVAGKKAGYWTASQIVTAIEAAGEDAETTTLALEPRFRGSWEPALKWYGDGLRLVTNPPQPGESIPPTGTIATLDSSPRQPSADARLLGELKDVHVAPVFFGYALDQSHDSVFYFALLEPRLEKVGPPWQFGAVRRDAASGLYLYLLSEQYASKVRAQYGAGQ